MVFFGFVKEKLNEELPIYLKNILKWSGYDNRYSLANITENEINQIELFAKTQLKFFLSRKLNVNYEDYYNIYSENIDEFIILPGHKKLLLVIGEMCGEENNKLKLKDSFFNDDCNAKRRKILYLPASNSPEDINMEGNENIVNKVNDDHRSRDDVNSHVEFKYVYDICYQWIKKYSDSLSEAEKNKVIETLHRLGIRISSSTVEDTIYFAYIKCSICLIEIKTQKRVRREGNSTWLISNFYKHFKAHFTEKLPSSEKKMGNILKNSSSIPASSYQEEEENDSLSYEEVEYENCLKQEMLD